MKRNLNADWFLISASLIGLLFFGTEAAAANDANGWRPTYDLIMRIANFLILVIVIVKFARVPLGNFLKSKKEEISNEIEQMEDKKKNAEFQLQDIYHTLEESNVRFEKLKQRIIRQGELKKKKLIDDARKESRIMLEGAKRKTDHRITQAKNVFRSEMIDSAVEIALKRIPEKITEEDNDKLLSQFLAGTVKK